MIQGRRWKGTNEMGVEYIICFCDMYCKPRRFSGVYDLERLDFYVFLWGGIDAEKFRKWGGLRNGREKNRSLTRTGSYRKLGRRK
jgi:hypothetical protein